MKEQLRNIIAQYRDIVHPINHYITNELEGFYLETADDIPALDDINTRDFAGLVSVKKEYGVYEAVNGQHRYTVHCPYDYINDLF